METVKILMNVMLGHIAVRLRKIVIIKYHFISVPVTLATSIIRMAIALIWTSVLMVITIVTQMPTVSIVTAAIHVAVIQDIARVSTWKIFVFGQYFGIFRRLETLIKVIWWITVWLKIRKKVEYVYKLTNVLTILIIATLTPIVSIKMVPLAVNVKKDMMVMDSNAMILTNALIICIHAMLMQFVLILLHPINANVTRLVLRNDI